MNCTNTLLWSNFFEDFIEEKGFINFFVRFFFLVICYNLYLIDFSDVLHFLHALSNK
jgi:hypothetical protein